MTAAAVSRPVAFGRRPAAESRSAAPRPAAVAALLLSKAAGGPAASVPHLAKAVADSSGVPKTFCRLAGAGAATAAASRRASRVGGPAVAVAAAAASRLARPARGPAAAIVAAAAPVSHRARSTGVHAAVAAELHRAECMLL